MIAPHGPSTGIAKAVTIEVKVTASPTERSKLPAMTTKVRPIATSALTIIENKMLLRLESVRNHGDAKPKPIAVSTMTEIVPQRRSRRSHNASAAAARARATFVVPFVIAVVSLMRLGFRSLLGNATLAVRYC